ncbi:prion-inhibition and propagation-domain-containing protein [Staphylotrichum tortipilum]|uniref:Prion-inhibition and propagation-domain-containing protein n=1 Tax=Staphylotrichum tortipilum TaxID=2831512 RepID=A0AAN6MEJ6_9PEZI|nr:prion-inhibition and propagation-domain-containing protein [Staphylotrichum longicolle]
MEPVGLTLAVVGLAGLFSTCVDCFQLVQKGRYLGNDYHILETKYNNQRIRLLAWGRVCGFVGETHSGGDRLLLQWSEEVQDAVSETLQHIATLFQDHQRLFRRYGLSRSGPLAATSSLVAASSTLSSLTRRFRAPAATRPGPGVRAAAQWAIADKDKFAVLVTDLKHFIDDLEALTSDMGVARRQRHFIQVEVESICEESELGYRTSTHGHLRSRGGCGQSQVVAVPQCRQRFLRRPLRGRSS